jgi:lipopolysaccharide transport system permease protein
VREAAGLVVARDLDDNLEPLSQRVVERRLAAMTEEHDTHAVTRSGMREKLTDRLRAAVCRGDAWGIRRDGEDSQLLGHECRMTRGGGAGNSRGYDATKAVMLLRAAASSMAIQQRTTFEPAGGRAAAAARAAEEKPLLEVSGGPGRLTAASFRELWHFREVLTAFVLRQFKIRYKQAVLGIGWAVLQPVAAAAIFALFLGRYTSLSSEGVPYLVFALAGMVAWSFFSTAAGNGADSLLSNSAMLRKLYFPREILPLSSAAAGLIDLVPALAILAVVAAAYGYTPVLPWLAIPIAVVILLLFGVAFSLALSAVNVYYRDVKYIVPFVLQIGLFATPVVYSASTVPASWRSVYESLNPVAAAIEVLRRSILHGRWPAAGPTLGALGWSLLLLLVALALFKRLERGFADRI